MVAGVTCEARESKRAARKRRKWLGVAMVHTHGRCLQKVKGGIDVIYCKLFIVCHC